MSDIFKECTNMPRTVQIDSLYKAQIFIPCVVQAVRIGPL